MPKKSPEERLRRLLRLIALDAPRVVLLRNARLTATAYRLKENAEELLRVESDNDLQTKGDRP